MSKPTRSGLTTYRDLIVWQKAMDLVEAIYRSTNPFPSEERFGLVSQMRRASVSIPSNIAEGYGRKDRGDYCRHLSYANGSLKELETQILIALRLGFFTDETQQPLWDLAQEVGRLMNGLRASLSEP
jgi:four helix bundle protein